MKYYCQTIDLIKNPYTFGSSGDQTALLVDSKTGQLVLVGVQRHWVDGALFF